MSDQYRFGDETPPAARSERLFQEGDTGGWFFRTREGTPMGPFETAEEADQALRDFIEFIRLADLQTLSELTRALAHEEAAALSASGAADASTAATDSASAANVDAAVDAAFPSERALLSVGAWDPGAHAAAPSTDSLTDYARRFAALVASNGEPRTDRSTLAALTSEDDRAQFASWMRLPLSTWPRLSSHLKADELITLVRLFTLAEKELPGCAAGKQSPAIAFAKELRRRGSYPATLTAWIRQHSDNRFLPYGSLLER